VFAFILIPGFAEWWDIRSEKERDKRFCFRLFSNKGTIMVKNRIYIMARMGAFIVCAAAILWLSLSSDPPQPDIELLSWDKLWHALAYAVLTWLGIWAFSPFFHPVSRAWVVVLVFALCYGALMEILQMLCTENRSCEFGDLLADGTGSVLVFAAAKIRSFFY
jgi:VanZ family protein